MSDSYAGLAAGLNEKVLTLRDALNALAEAVEQDAAEKAWEADFGASEWAAFVPRKVYEALAVARAALREADDE